LDAAAILIRAPGLAQNCVDHAEHIQWVGGVASRKTVLIPRGRGSNWLRSLRS